MPATSTPARSGARPGGRSARVRAAVHRALQELLTEQPGETPTIPAVAARAGVHATTLYRRWGDIRELLTDAATSRFSGDLVVPDTGSLRGDLERFAVGIAKDLGDPDTLAVARATIGSGAQGASACTADRRHQLEAMLGRERSRGQDAPDAERATDVLLAPLYYRAIFTDLPLTPEWARSLVLRLLPD